MVVEKQIRILNKMCLQMGISLHSVPRIVARITVRVYTGVQIRARTFTHKRAGFYAAQAIITCFFLISTDLYENKLSCFSLL
jgi:hypothetical protein